jgi:anti-sigma regulatory factor (Ser/Thr protein kinase)
MSGGSAVTRLSDAPYEPSPTVASEVRRALRDLLAGWELSEQVLTDALLIVEEFVANVVDHAGTAFDITVERAGAALRLAVRDRSDRPAVVQRFDPTAARGRGLQIVTAVADSWGCDWHPNGKTIWASLAA